MSASGAIASIWRVSAGTGLPLISGVQQARGLSAGASNGRDQIHSIRRSDARASTRFVATHCRAKRFVHQREMQLTAEHLVRRLAAIFAADVADYSR
jgi:hypothetical protein